MKMLRFILVALTLATVACAQDSRVQFGHLQHLTEIIDVQGRRAAIVHVYANHPTYEWVDAKESGPEGIACVDDAARAAVVYLRHFELTGSRESLDRSRLLLTFVMSMQADDGEFYNFVFADRSINRMGKTSFKSFGWWAARGMWCFGLGYRIWTAEDPSFASELKRRFDRSLPHVRSLLARYGEEDTVDGLRSPRWLLYESGADATSELVLGLVEYYKATRSGDVGDMIRKLCEGFIIMQDGDARSYPYGLHRSWRTMWHMWGNGQSQALAAAGMALDEPRFVASAEREATGWYSRLIIQGFLKEFDVARSESEVPFEHIAYGLRPMTVALVRLYEATGKEQYLVMAGLSASWLTGNNAAGHPMYDVASGRGYDGIRDSNSVNLNSGAESTIEALHTLIEVERFERAKSFLDHRRTSASGSRAEFEGPTPGSRCTVHLDPETGSFTIYDASGNGFK